MSNQQIAKILMEMSSLYAMEGVEWKPRAYERASQGVDSFSEDIEAIYKEGGRGALKKIPGVGDAIAGHIAEFFETGHFSEYERLKKKIPVDSTGLTAIEGLGARSLKVLWEKLKIRTIDELEDAIQRGKVQQIAHFGEKSAQKILKGIAFLKSSGGRKILGFVEPEIRELEEVVRKFPEVDDLVVAGSVRRRKETIGDIDLLVVSKKGVKVSERFQKLPQVEHVYDAGPTKINVRLRMGLDADLRVVERRSFGAALHYFTGSKEHNVALREIAIKKGYKLNEYGLYKGKRQIAGETEADVYKALELAYIEPELRENRGEIEAASRTFEKKVRDKLPQLIGYKELRGDLQIQTTWTDGKDSIETMAREAMKRGLEYIAITDHTRSLAMTGGADEKKLLRQMKEIDTINSKLSANDGFVSGGKTQNQKFKILKGAEVNILKDGSLDISDEVLAQLDVVGVAVHSHFTLSREDQTRRIIRAMENPNIDILFHPTGRILNKRASLALNMDTVIAAARRTGTILEIDAFPDRLDLNDEYIRRCVGAGVKMSIDSDAHALAHYSVLEYGIAQARRGWAEKKDIINAHPLEQMLKMLK